MGVVVDFCLENCGPLKYATFLSLSRRNPAENMGEFDSEQGGGIGYASCVIYARHVCWSP